MTQYNIYYWSASKVPDNKFIDIFLHGDVNFTDISSIYTKVISIKHNGNLDDIFSLFNSEDNPLSNPERQSFIRDNQLHTSMSVGDIIECKSEDSTEWFSVAGRGFKKIITDKN